MDDKVIRLDCGAYRKWVWIHYSNRDERVLWKERIGAMAGPVGKLPA